MTAKTEWNHFAGKWRKGAGGLFKSTGNSDRWTKRFFSLFCMCVCVLSFPMQLCECLCVYVHGCVSTMQDRVGFEGLRLSSEVGRGLRASAGSPVITADVECLQRDEEGRGWGGTETAAFTLYCKLHTHKHTSTYTEGCSCTGNPTSPAVCMCVFVLQLARWDQWLRVTAIHTSVPWLQLNTVQAGWVRGWWMLTDQAGHTQWIFFAFLGGCSLLSYLQRTSLTWLYHANGSSGVLEIKLTRNAQGTLNNL